MGSDNSIMSRGMAFFTQLVLDELHSYHIAISRNQTEYNINVLHCNHVETVELSFALEKQTNNHRMQSYIIYTFEFGGLSLLAVAMLDTFRALIIRSML